MCRALARPWARTLVLGLACSGAGAVLAADATVVVIGQGAEQRVFDAPYAVGVVDADELRAAGPMVNLSEVMARVPGLVVNLRQNYAQDLQISSRGFGARASFGVRGMRLYSDGIPAAGPDGQGQVSHFDLAGAERIEVLRGPFSALYGNGSGGVIALISKAPTAREFSTDLDAGSDGMRQLRTQLALPLAGGLSLRASASQFDTDGTRPHSAARRRAGNVRLGWQGEADSVVLVLNSLDQPAQDPLGLNRAQFNADPTQTTSQAKQFNTRKQLWQDQAGLQWQHRFDGAGALRRSNVALYSGRRSVTQWLAIPPGAQAAASSGGGVVDFDRQYGGLDARLHWQLAGLRLSTGLSQDSQRDDRRGFENFSGSGATQQLGITGRQRRNEINRARSRDVYAQAELDLSEQLTAVAGLRHGRLDIASADRDLSNGDQSGALRYRFTTPVLALRWQPSSTWSLYISAARGHEAPTLGELAYRPDGGSGLNDSLRPQTSRQVELGAKWRPAPATSLDLALFRADTEDELGIQTNQGGRSTFQNVGRTQRQGLELGASWRLADAWRTRVAATWLDATYRDGFLTCAASPCAAPTLAVPAGNRIAGTLPHSGFAELVWAHGLVELGLEASVRGRQPVNDVNSDFAAGYALLALRASWSTPLAGGRLELRGRVDNLADRAVAGSVIVGDTNGRFFEPAAGRSWLVGLRWKSGF